MESLGAPVLLAVAWLVVVAVLVLDLTGRWRRGAGFRWQAVGLLLGLGAVLTSAVARLRGWPDGQLHGLLMITDPATVAGAVLVLVGAFVQLRTLRRGRGPAE
jgi:hypothetical protein